MPVSIRWTELHDPDTDETWCIAPDSGALVTLPRRGYREGMYDRVLWRHGLTPDRHMKSFELIDEHRDEATPPRGGPGLGGRVLHAGLWAALRVAPLDRLVRGVAWLARRMPSKRMDKDEIRAKTRQATSAGTGQCLPRALLRWYYLINAGYEPALTLGIWQPTDFMHAWITLDGHAYGELADEVMHYKPCTRFVYRREGAA